jgi:hypothetical protein
MTMLAKRKLFFSLTAIAACILFCMVIWLARPEQKQPQHTNHKYPYLWSAEDYVYNNKSFNGQRRVDVVIPAHEKDSVTLGHCVRAAKKYIANVGRVIVVSRTKLTNNAEFFPESNFPFSVDHIEQIIKDHIYWWNPFTMNAPNTKGWYFAQLAKLLAPIVIPDLSNDVLVLDSDNIFTKPVTFTIDKDAAYFHVNKLEEEYQEAYFNHMNCLLPGLKLQDSRYTGIVHHQLIMRDILEDLINRVEKAHGESFHVAFMKCSDFGMGRKSAPSEFEIIFNFMLQFYKHRTILRELHWENKATAVPQQLFVDQLPDEGFKEFGAMVSVHSYMRKK